MSPELQAQVEAFDRASRKAPPPPPQTFTVPVSRITVRQQETRTHYNVPIKGRPAARNGDVRSADRDGAAGKARKHPVGRETSRIRPRARLSRRG
jgi:hypothetical protein